jgi:hypothetical protein
VEEGAEGRVRHGTTLKDPEAVVVVLEIILNL